MFNSLKAAACTRENKMLWYKIKFFCGVWERVIKCNCFVRKFLIAAVYQCFRQVGHFQFHTFFYEWAAGGWSIRLVVPTNSAHVEAAMTLLECHVGYFTSTAFDPEWNFGTWRWKKNPRFAANLAVIATLYKNIHRSWRKDVKKFKI